MQEGGQMQSKDLAKRIRSKQQPTVVDVRSGFEFRSGHIPGAIHAPAWKILLRLAKLPADRNAELVVTCEHGPRAQLAKGLLSALGYRNVALLDGHMAGWRQAGGAQDI
jgi:hydroxyacylglutathione hydrolase